MNLLGTMSRRTHIVKILTIRRFIAIMPVLFLNVRGVWSTAVCFHVGGEVGCSYLRHVTDHV